MEEDAVIHGASLAGLTISPSLDLVAENTQVPQLTASIDRRVVWLCGVAIVLGVAGALLAEALIKLIALITNLSFYGRFSIDPSSPANNHLGYSSSRCRFWALW